MNYSQRSSQSSVPRRGGSSLLNTIGFVGLGTMGRPMARNLVAAGHELVVLCRNERHHAAAAEVGARAVDRVDELAEMDAVLSIVQDSPDVLALALGENGLLARLRPGSLYIDLSTIRPDAARSVHEVAAQHGIDFLDAPVSGGEAAAIEGTLAIMVGGHATAVERARPILSALGSAIVHVGGPGTGQVVKAANQLVVAGNLQVLAEAVAFLEAHHTDLSAALEVIGSGLAGSTVLLRKRESVLAGEYAPGFRLDLHHKDLGIVADAARKHALGLPTTAIVLALVAILVRRGDGNLDHSALVALSRELNK